MLGTKLSLGEWCRLAPDDIVALRALKSTKPKHPIISSGPDGNKSTRWEFIRRGNSMLHLYLAAVSAVVVANVITTIAIATTLRRGPSRFWRLWLKS
jgi:hypothetical protein